MKIIYALFAVVVTTLLFLWWRSEFALPIFCTTRGCVTNAELQKETAYQLAFAQAAHSAAPTKNAVMTTLVRKHLILTTQNNTATTEDAIKYRTDILHLTDEEHLKQLGFTSFEEYDREVTIPFLLQQTYMNEHSLKNPEEAYSMLSTNFRVVSLLFDYTWDSSKGEAVAR